MPQESEKATQLTSMLSHSHFKAYLHAHTVDKTSPLLEWQVMLVVDMIHANLNHICHKAESTQDGRFCHTSGKHDHLLSPLHQTLTKEINSNMQNVERNEKEKHIHKDNHGSAHKKRKEKKRKIIWFLCINWFN